MAVVHKTVLKRARQTARKQAINRQMKKQMRKAMKALRELTDAGEAKQQLPKVVSLLDRMAQKGFIHKATARRYTGRLAHKVASLA